MTASQSCAELPNASRRGAAASRRVLVELAPEGARDVICVVAATLIARSRSRRLDESLTGRPSSPLKEVWLGRRRRR
jgi:hypothetical protein